MNIKKIKVGDKVEVTKVHVPYYSGYAGNPTVVITAGTIGIVGATNVPYVRNSQASDKGRGDYFVCVDFKVRGKFDGNPTLKQNKWRCAVDPKNLKKVK